MRRNCTHPLQIQPSDWPWLVEGDRLTLEQSGALIQLVLYIWGEQRVPDVATACLILNVQRRTAARLKLEALLEIAERLTRQRAPVSAYERARLAAEAGGHCTYCRTPLPEHFEVDHAVPVVRGGRNVFENYRASCRPCNRAKGTMTEAEFRTSRGEVPNG